LSILLPLKYTVLLLHLFSSNINPFTVMQ
jgi:hypothetical protein